MDLPEKDSNGDGEAPPRWVFAVKLVMTAAPFVMALAVYVVVRWVSAR